MNIYFSFFVAATKMSWNPTTFKKPEMQSFISLMKNFQRINSIGLLHFPTK